MNVAFSLWPTRANGQHRRVWPALGPGNFISRPFISTGSEARDEGVTPWSWNFRTGVQTGFLATTRGRGWYSMTMV
jgi:hypothetical protein